jgi:hypothetical protein
MKRFLSASIVFLLFLSGFKTMAQISSGGLPPTIEYGIINNNYPEISLESPDTEKLLSEDNFTDKHGIAMRFAVDVAANIDLAKDGTWMRLQDGSSICRLAITARNAQALIAYYKAFEIPQEGKLFLYNQSRSQVIGAFTHKTNPKRSAFATEMITGETTILEYHAPAGQTKLPVILIEDMGFVYRTVSDERGFGNAGFCEVNVNCPEGEQWQDQTRGIARIIVKQGGSSVWCTGSLVNNTRFDSTPYFLTADHCGPTASPQNYDQWVFYFRYQGDSCENPGSDSTFKDYTIIGCTKLAAAGGSGVESDFKLVVLNEMIPDEYEPFYNGWSNADEPSDFGVTIHHPQGDVKKISTYTTPLISTNWGSVPNTHWRVVWSETETNHGVTEPGSSGSPIFNADGFIIGQLTGGDASCANLSGPDYYGKFSHSWESIGDTATTQLKPWLDPDDSGITQLGGFTSTRTFAVSETNATLFPNPTRGIAFLDPGENSSAITSVLVTDMAGRVILSKELSQDWQQPLRIDLTNYEGGLYFVQIRTEKNVQTLKLIRQP